MGAIPRKNGDLAMPEKGRPPSGRLSTRLRLLRHDTDPIQQFMIGRQLLFA